MPRVTGLDVTFRRTRQPAQYETAEAAVSIHVAVDDNEAVDLPRLLTENMVLASTVVYERLGLLVAAKPAAPEVAPVGPIQPVAPISPVASSTAAGSVPASTPKRTRRTKAEIAADAAATAAPAGTPSPTPSAGASIPDDPSQTTAPTASAAGAATSATPTSTAPATAEPSDQDLIAAATKAAGRIGPTGPALVKAKIAEFGVVRLGELKDLVKRRAILVAFGELKAAG